ncbi:MAG: putative lipid II flippase FtsW [Candidatus Omnitrophica bacterium]|nr:putative lipid II flippase FtsW [Candidatus Omnitrophota bacterium]
MRKTRLIIFTNLFILLLLGIIMIYSSSCIYAQSRYNDEMFFLKKHIIFVLLGLFLMFGVMCFDYRILKQKAKPLLLLAFLLLILVLIPFIGKELGGARRWFRFGVLSFQPSEFANMALVLYIADCISRKKTIIQENFFRGMFPPLLVLVAMAVLILIQPDLGTVFALGLVVFIMFFVAGVPMRYLIFIMCLSLGFFYILIFTSAYRRARIMAFINPWQDPKRTGFQIIQSNIALGSGGLFGVGLGHSRQKLFYLPASHTDFIFSIIGEELGLLGTLSVCFLFLNLIMQGLKVSRFAPDVFGTFLSLGIIMIIGLKAVINIGVSCGVLPPKGLPLPFISYGGSSLVFDMIGVGLILNISRFSCLLE